MAAPASPGSTLSLAASVKRGILPTILIPVSPSKKEEVEAFDMDAYAKAGFHTTTASTHTALKAAPLAPAIAGSQEKLIFCAYFNEGVPESAKEAMRTRGLVLTYRVKDNTIEIHEPLDRARNDGMLVGKFLKRSQIPAITKENFIHQLQIGNTLEVWGRVMQLYACDDSTRKFFANIGLPQAPNMELPEDEYTKTNAALAAKYSSEAWHGVRISAITRFLEAQQGCQRNYKTDLKGRYALYDGIVLRFLLRWQTTEAGRPMKVRYWLSYYLVTEEAEVVEEKGQRNYAYPAILLRRARLPRRYLGHDDRMRSCEDVGGEEDYYTEDDFRVGSRISILGRDMEVCDCDRATQEWYLSNKHLDQQASRIDTSEPPAPKVELLVPPHTGIGSEEDTAANWNLLIPKQPRKDLSKRTGKCLRWKAHMVTKDPVDSTREFYLIYSLDTREVSVYEPSVRNSGIVTGLFMRSLKLRNPATGDYYTEADFRIGEDIVVNGFRFHVLEMAE